MQQQAVKLGIVGVGKIVKDQHLPSIYSGKQFELSATASRHGEVPGVVSFKTIESMLDAMPELQAVALCMPPQYRFSAAKVALERGLDVLLEKPPGATVSEVAQLATLAEHRSSTLYATWHSRHGPAIQTAKELLAESQITAVRLDWKEDVRKWHPNQEWIWQAGGLGVFDPGINGLSILTDVLPDPLYVTSASLEFPSNKAAPIGASIEFCTASGMSIPASFDWRQRGDEVWDIEFITDKGVIKIGQGGSSLCVDDQFVALPEHSPISEYQAIYARFADLINSQTSDVDLRPLQLVADAFMLANRVIVDPFYD